MLFFVALVLPRTALLTFVSVCSEGVGPFKVKHQNLPFLAHGDGLGLNGVSVSSLSFAR